MFTALDWLCTLFFFYIIVLPVLGMKWPWQNDFRSYESYENIEEYCLVCVCHSWTIGVYSHVILQLYIKFFLFIFLRVGMFSAHMVPSSFYVKFALGFFLDYSHKSLIFTSTHQGSLNTPTFLKTKIIFFRLLSQQFKSNLNRYCRTCLRWWLRVRAKYT